MTEHVAISRYALSPELTIEDFGDEALLFLPEGDLIINVNKAAALIMEQCKNTFDEQPSPWIRSLNSCKNCMI